MNSSKQSVTLQTAVLMTTKEFAAANKEFSVHDITKTIRDKTSTGELEIPEVETFGKPFRYNINHSAVKNIFDELWRSGVFDTDFTLDRTFNGIYFVYTASVPSNSSVSVNQTVMPTPALAPTPAQKGTPVFTSSTSPQLTVNPVQPSQDDSPETIKNRVKTYLTNCTTKNFRPTLKQVQSAIKRGNVSTGWSCEELKKYIETDLGVAVIPDPDAISHSQVAVV